MAPLPIVFAYAVAMAVVIPATIAQSSDSIPSCLTECLEQTTQPCTTSSLPLLIDCINTQCTSKSDSNAEDSASSMTLTYTPKVQYSCQQSSLPGSSEESPSMQLTGDGICKTSPYAFQSMFVSASSATDDDDGRTLQKLARQCSMMLYPDEECKGEETKLDLGDVQGDKCVFHGGRSARLMCSALRAPDTPSYASVLSSLCANGTSPAPAASNTTSPYTGSGSGGTNATSSTESPQPSLTSVPYTGRATADQVAKPSLIALVALFAVAVLLL